jgi:predicted aspartyl protease
MMRLYAAALAMLFFAPLAGRADEVYAPTTLTAVDVLQKAESARGRLASGSYKIVTTSHGSGLDRTAATYIDGDDSIANVVAGPFATAYGTYDKRDWDRDENGIVTVETGFHDRENPNARALDHPEDPANRVTMLGVTGASPSFYAIDVNPPDGEHQTLYYATDTFLLARSVMWATDRLKHVTTYDDYRRVFGSTHAFHSSYSDGRADNDTDTTTLSIAPTKDAVDFAIPASSSILAFSSAKPLTLPARFIDGTIIVRANVGGRGLDFELDTGSSSMTINPDVAHDLGLAAYDRRSGTIGGNFDESRTIVSDIAIGDLHVHNAVFSEVPVANQLPDVKVVGLLGFDFISNALLAIDFKKQTLTFYPPGAALPSNGVVTSVPIELDDRVPRASASVNGIKGKFLIDTGSEATVLFHRFAQTVPGRTVLADGEQYSLSFIGGDVSAQAFSIDNLLFGPLEFAHADVLVPASSTGEITDYDGIIGQTVLNFYVLYLDYAHHQLYLQPNA